MIKSALSWPLMLAAGLCITACGNSPNTAPETPDAAATEAATATETDATQPAAGNALYQQIISAQNPSECFKGVTLQSTNSRVPAGETPPQLKRLVIALDASGSMAAKFGAQTKMEAARQATLSYLADVPATVQVGLVVFGHQGSNDAAGKAASCAGVETRYPLGQPNRAAITRAVRQFEPTGWTPLAAAIKQAASLLNTAETAGEQVLWVVSDGRETCGGDPVAAARQANTGPLKLIVNIVGFDLQSADRSQLRAVAEAGGGEFVEARQDQMSDLRTLLAQSAARLSNSTGAAATNLKNSTESSAALLATTTCIQSILTGETTRFSQALIRQSSDAAVKRDLAGAQLLLKRRHQQIKDLLARYSEAVTTNNEQQQQEVNTELQRVLTVIDSK